MSSTCRNCFSPAPRGPSRFASGTRQPANDSGLVSDAFQPIFRYGSPTSYPGVPFATSRFEISRRPSLSPVTAVIVTSAEMSVPALVMNCLAPSITHSPPSSRACVRVLPASDPASGSVSPNAASRSPEVSRGSHSCFCSSVPNR